ncbi:MAG: hypothetical protein H7281_16400 [Bacteriovorax sp.]|nr:hypothetical protein [Bacteriovorax sp.]
MIHNSSSDPVLIKKISLKIWSLRDEIEARINDKLEAGTPSGALDLMEIRAHYSPKNLQNNNVLSLKPNAELDTGEDEMARAMAEVEAEESSETAEAATDSEAGSENVIDLAPQTPPENVVSIDQNIISISLDAPNIPEDKVSKGKTVLSEISMDKMFFFCNKPFTEGQSIVIQFCIPKSFIVNADILYCRPFNLKSRIISQNNYTHRALIRFNFLKEGERALLRQFLQSIEPDLVKVEKKAEASKNDNDGSDFGDLDDLGL